MSRRPMSAFTLAVALASAPTAAHSMGLCENLSSRWHLDAVSEKSAQVAISGELEWCEETEDGEKRGEVHAAQIRDFSGQVSQWYVREAGPKAAQHLGRIAQNDAALPMDKLAARKKEQGFVAAAELLRSPSGRCTARVAEKVAEGGTVSLTLTIEVDGKQAWSTPLAEGIASDEEREVQTLYLPSKRALLVWATLPRCVGGPPPGYFGEDDPGECFVEAELHLKLHEATGTRLIACFEAAKDSPAANDGAKKGAVKDGAHENEPAKRGAQPPR